MATSPTLMGMTSHPLTHFVRATLWRVALSVIVPAAWIGATLVYVAFYAPGLTAFQDFVVVVVSLLALLGAIVGMWVAYGLRLFRRWVDEW